MAFTQPGKPCRAVFRHFHLKPAGSKRPPAAFPAAQFIIYNKYAYRMVLHQHRNVLEIVSAINYIIFIIAAGELKELLRVLLIPR
jgi:hypothetical protein